MELQKTSSTKSMSKILKYLPRATSSVTFQNHSIYSPVKDKKSLEKLHKSNLGIGFSVIIISPDNDLRKSKKHSTSKLAFEPTSPRVSCMGQVKCKHYRKLVGAANKKPLPITQKPISRTMSFTPLRTYNNEDYQEKVDPVAVKSKKKSGFRSIFSCSSKKCDNLNNKSTVMMNLSKAPCLSTMKKFSSGRDAFATFDWTTQVVPLDNSHQSCYTDDEEITVPSSTLVMMRNKGFCDDFIKVGGVNLEPRKEINLWKRRTMAQPKPLQLQVAA